MNQTNKILYNSNCPVLLNSSDENYKDIAENLPKEIDYAGTGRLTLDKFFVQYYDIKIRDDNDTFKSDGLIDKSGEAVNFSPPTVYSLNLSACFESEKQTCFAQGANGFTVNHNNGETNETPLIYSGSANATVDFFALADDNHMPIRRVMIDWNDGEILNEKQFGFYKNRKPFCEQVDGAGPPTVGRCASKDGKEKTQITCQTDSDCAGLKLTCKHDDTNRYFGDASRACTSHYFEFVHDYTCSAETDAKFKKTVGELSEVEKKALTAKGYSATANVCVFTPKVQLLDNWGWCNGTCTDLVDLDKDGNTTEKRNGCYNGNIVKECDAEFGNIYAEQHWTNYQGKIIVVPESQ